MLNPKLVTWFKKDRGSKILGALVLLAVAIALLMIRLSQEKVASEYDLSFIRGQLKNYQFTDGSRGFHDYIIWLDGISTPFQVKADFLNLFRAKKFKQLHYGDTLVIGLSKYGFDQVRGNTSKRVFVYSVKSGNDTFLDGGQTVKKHNSPFMFYACAFFILLGITMIYFLYQT